MWQVGQESRSVTQGERCYSPADLRLLFEGTGLRLEAFEPFNNHRYERTVPLAEAMLYLACLSHSV